MFTPSGFKDIGLLKFEFEAKTQFFYFSLSLRKIKTRGGHIKMIKNPYNGLKRNRTLLKFGDGDGPNLCRVNKVDISSTFIENIFWSGSSPVLEIVSATKVKTNSLFFYFLVIFVNCKF